MEMFEESLWLVALKRELKEQPPGSLCRVISHTAEDLFLRALPSGGFSLRGSNTPPEQELLCPTQWSLSPVAEDSWRLFLND